MKLAVTLCALSFAIVGCVDEDPTTSAGQLGGIQSPKGAGDDVGDYENPYASLAQPEHQLAKERDRLTLEEIQSMGLDLPTFKNCKTGPCTVSVQYATVTHWDGLDDIIFFANDMPICHLLRDGDGTVFSDCSF